MASLLLTFYASGAVVVATWLMLCELEFVESLIGGVLWPVLFANVFCDLIQAKK